MDKVRIKNSDILAIPLDKYISGYGYAKYLDSQKVWGKEINIPGVLRICNFVTGSIEQDVSKINRDLLLAPVAVAGIKGIGKLGWRVIANESILKEEEFLPQVKGGWPHMAPVPERWRLVGWQYSHFLSSSIL